jgi:type IV pilus assembly protein PilB
LITATVEAILAQRLVRRICTQCREPVEPTNDALLELGLTREGLAGQTFFRGKGCDACNNTGYKGRLGLFELMLMNDQIRDMIMANASTDELREASRRLGMVTLRQAGISSLLAGTTTAEEVIRETVLEA